MSRPARRRPQEASGGSGGPTGGRARRRAKRAQPAPSAVPWQCVVLAVDTAARSGWSVRVAGKQSSFGEADTLDARALDYIVSWALYQADSRGLPLVLVLEAPWGGPMPMLLALGAARERWLVAWRAHRLPPDQVVKVQPSTWRTAVLGREWASAPRAEVRRHEQLIAGAMVRKSGDGDGDKDGEVRGDEAAAILIGRWAERAHAVGLALGKKRGVR